VILGAIRLIILVESSDFFMPGRSAPVILVETSRFVDVSGSLQPSQSFPSPEKIGHPAIVTQQAAAQIIFCKIG
jgi:hypothetical protein